MRPSQALACVTILLAAGGFGCAGRGALDASAASDEDLEALLGDFPTPGPNASDEIHDASGAVVSLPKERATFASRVVSYTVGAPSPIPEGQDPRAALGPPDYVPNKREKPRAVSLGNGGSIVLEFNQGVLVDGPGPDVFIFEIGPNVEAMEVDVSADGSSWIHVGTAPGGACAIDIGPRVKPGDVFRYVRLRDVPWGGADSDVWPGADIDAVAVVSAPQRVSVSSELLFAFDSDALTDAAGPEIDRLVSAIRARPGARVTIEGHTDDQGDDAYNQDLSERRARAVADALAKKGVPRDRIGARGYGETRPVVANDDAGRKKNRRVEIVIDDR